MTGIWLASYIVLWILVIVLLILVLTMARLLGLVYRRFPPYGARGAADGTAIGAKIPPYKGLSIDGREVQIPNPINKGPGVVIFVSPSCGACAELAPAIRSIWRSDRKEVDIVLAATAGDAETARSFVDENGLAGIPYVVAPEWAAANNVTGTPYVLGFDGESVVRAKGVANHLEHLDGLLEHLLGEGHSAALGSGAAS
jgi:methylamine dehydrogenase accessory protein MauD